ncbi:MAG: hypothetical protein JO261_11985, partial [Alphaproteobacteria bacterium]|nr:hypothetical protein [Alphaproteobacteria bacterium]
MSSATQAAGVSLKKRALRQKILNVALTSKGFRDALVEDAKEIREIAKPTATEAAIEGAFERVMYARLREIGLRFHPEKEVAIDLRRHLATGRTDSRLGALVIEYKRPSLLKSDGEIETAIAHLASYLRASSEAAQAPFIGILTNGIIAIEVRASGDAVTSKTAPQRLDAAFLLRMTRHVISLAVTALTPTNLIRDFCGSQDGVLLRTARTLNIALRQQLKTQVLHAEWEEMFRLTHDDQSQQKKIEERRKALAELFLVHIASPAEEYRALFALHTAYAVLLKFMAYRTVSDIYLG